MMLLTIIILSLLVGPLVVAGIGYWTNLSAGKNTNTLQAQSTAWSLIFASALCCVIAFNLTFFIQEIGLVLPKALTPGLIPTLFHNDHMWQGEHELAYLFQGTGALATMLSGLVSLYLVRSNRLQSVTGKLFFLWMAYHGLFMALPQFVIGAVNPYNDVGMAMDYFNLSATGKSVLAILALIIMPLLAVSLTRPFLSLAPQQSVINTRGGRTRFIARIVLIPALIALLLIVPYRIPREWIEVLVLPVIVLYIGVIWIQAYAWRPTAIRLADVTPVSLKRLAVGALALLLVFQFVLRPGITVSFFA